MEIYKYLFCVLLLVSCNGSGNNKANSEKLNEPFNDKFIYLKDSVIIPDFEIELKLTENATKKIKSDKESIIVQAYFSGIPTDKTNYEYIPIDGFRIGAFKVELFNDKIARFKNVKISRESFDKLENSDFEVLINVFTGRRTYKSNLLDSELIQQNINSIKGRRHQIRCNLINGE